MKRILLASLVLVATSTYADKYKEAPGLRMHHINNDNSISSNTVIVNSTVTEQNLLELDTTINNIVNQIDPQPLSAPAIYRVGVIRRNKSEVVVGFMGHKCSINNIQPSVFASRSDAERAIAKCKVSLPLNKPKSRVEMWVQE